MNIRTDAARLSATQPVPGPEDSPIRAGILQENWLRRLGEKLARGEVDSLLGLQGLDLVARNKENAEKILSVYRDTNAAQAAGEMITPAGQWLLDNNYLIEETIFQVRRDLPRRFYRELPLIALPDGGKAPRVLALAWAYVAHSDSTVSAATLRTLVEGFQAVEPLRIGELWALPSLLRFVLIENLRRIALRVNRARIMRRIANDVADRVLGSPEGDRLDILARYGGHARDATFATQLLFRLRDGSQNAGRALVWLESELEEVGADTEEAIQREHQTLSSGNVTAGNIVRGLRLINDIDWTLWFEEVSEVDRRLRAASDFAELDFPSRNQYRGAIEGLAKGSGQSEWAVADRAVELAARAAAEGSPTADVGFFLIGSRLPEFEAAIGFRVPFALRAARLFKRTDWLGVVLPVIVLTLLLLTAAAASLRMTGLSTGAITLLLLLFAVPASEGALGFFNTFVLLFLSPTRLVGYEYKAGPPEEARTLVVVPALIGSRDDVDDGLRNLEVHYLANMRGAITFALLTDWPDSAAEQTADDLALLTYARGEIDRLNKRYFPDGPRRFHVLHRRRLFNPAQGVWMGWERKRGKLHELNLLLRGDTETTFFPTRHKLPDDVQYVMTLDADTRMTRDVVARLVGKMRHPLNRPVFDEASGRVASGYAILQPRVTPSLTTGDEASFFQRVFSANRGLDPYVFAVSEVYQDVFGEGTFTGKGIYHVDAFERALKGRIPENAVLSHDLLEGSLARAGLASDVELVEDYPTRYLVDASRQHRWSRGDWQLLGYILDPRSGVPGLSRWKMVDNLRRTLTPIFWILGSVAGWSLLPFSLAAQWQALLILSLFMAPTFDIVNAVLPRTLEVTVRGHLRALWRDVAFGTAMVALRIVLMAHLAWMMADAIVRTLFRLFVSRRNLLEWRTASQAARGGVTTVAAHYRAMWGAVAVAVPGLALPMLAGSTGAGIALFFAGLWIASPAFAWLISRSAVTQDRLEVSVRDAAYLRAAARRTWAYFETFVTPEQNFLPPDNFQERPAPKLATRTSPTNIGMYLLSVVAARDMGWISLTDAAGRIDATLGALEKMERFNGHLYNWYDTTTLRPLHPLYVSSVDSGNLAGHLIALAAACGEWASAPAVHLQGDFDGVLDAVAVLDETAAAIPDDRRQLRPLRQRLRDRLEGVRRVVADIKRQPELASVRTINLTVAAGEVRKLAGTLHAELGSAGEELSLWAQRLAATCEAHVQDAHTSETALRSLRERFASLKERARLIAFQMDFSFLMRADRKLLSIGYRVDERQLDESCYDLLASEARLTSLFAIAKGDLPTEHWLRLGRPIVEVGFSGALLSWSGSMFEYLMPPLVMKEPQGGILNQTSQLIIARQMRYGREARVPWGISEAAYNARDREMNYQYTNFGVPGLALKRGQSLNLVVAPYATLLAAQFDPRGAVENLRRLRGMGALGRYGFFDAVDFTPARVPEGQRYALVENYMAHHQGMGIVAVLNAVSEGRMRDRFHSDPVIEAAELLLQEKAPRDIPVATVRTEAQDRPTGEEDEASPDTRLIRAPATAPTAVSLLSNGRFSAILTATGAGGGRWNDIAVTRWQPDAVEAAQGTFLFLRDIGSGRWWSATAEPKRAEGEECFALFSDDKAVFVKSVGGLRSEVECLVLSEAAGEARRITISNEGDADRHIEVTSFAELALAPEAADNAHPAFSKMFVETEVLPGRGVIFAARRKRSPSESDIALAHFVTDASRVLRDVEAETDRRAFVGRGRTLADAAAFDPGARLAGGHGFTLDPVAALRRRVRVPANKKVALTFWTVVGASRAEVEADIGRLVHAEAFARQSMLSWTLSQVQLRHMGVSLAEAALMQRLAGFLLFPDPALRMPAPAIAAGLGRQSALWPLSVSGDFPIFVLRISDISDIEIVADALRYHEYLRAHGLLADVVVVNEQASSYVQDLQQAIEQLCENSRLRMRELGPRQHIFAARRDLMDAAAYRTLLAAARVVMHARNGNLPDQIERAEAAVLKALPEQEAGARGASAAPAPSPKPPEDLGEGLTFWNGFGGFDRDGADYVVRLSGRTQTPQPWINVVANGQFGFHTSAEGASFTWSRNSRDFQLTRWSNDPVGNRPGEGLYLFDAASGAAFSPFAFALRDPGAVYEARFGQGFASFSAKRGALRMEATQLVDPVDPVKVTRLRLRNEGRAPMRLRAYAFAEWVLGNNRARSAPTIVPAYDAAAGALLAQNPFSLEFGERVAFLASDGPPSSWTADRGEFLGRAGSILSPQAVLAGAALSKTVEAARDPCAALARDVELAPGQTVDLLWFMGDAAGAEEAASLVGRHREIPFEKRLADNEARWRGFLEAIEVETPDPAFNFMVNRWLPYQAFACRIQARAAFYQSSGAFGFRDQLQDTLALLLHDPGLARAQILNAARRQFAEGDVQHWWLPRTDAGVRTTISDDVAWLAYGAHRYIEVTGDRTILDEELPWIEGPALQPGEHDAFFTPELSRDTSPLYEHCARALDLAVRRTSARGLPLILGGDWNDGMNRVGEQGMGESVWLGWFLIKTLRDFAGLAEARGDGERAAKWRAHADRVAAALHEHAWDGEWFIRGTFDDGSPLGSSRSDECRIDSLAQSWAVISGAGEPERARRAVDAALAHLVDEDAGIVRLFTPPFRNSAHDPGYIKSYPPGVRENGGQYTHGATWLVVALARQGRGDEAYRLWSMLNPLTHALDAEAAELYRIEPYVVAGDVYGAEKAGRGGWSWYTGSAGWMLRTAVESILGVEKRGDRLTFDPAVPNHWPGFSATLRFGEGTVCRIAASRSCEIEAVELLVDGIAADAVVLEEGKEIRVTLRLPAAG